MSLMSRPPGGIKFRAGGVASTFSAPVDAVQKFVDAEIDRIEFMQGKNR